MTAPAISAYFDEATNSVSYLVHDPATGVAAIIDPVLDFEAASGKVSTGSADHILAAAAGLKVAWILETHAHADHLSAASYLKAKTGAKIGIGAEIGQVQAIFRPRFGLGVAPAGDGFDALFAEGEQIPLGSLSFQVMQTPGHTPACATYRIADAAFIGDTLFMPDYGSARADFPGGDAAALYRSIQRILALPPETRLFLCHDYKAPGRDHFAWESTVAEQRAHNIHVHAGVSEAAYVAMRTSRDATLAVPKLLLPALQANIRGGRLPEADTDGVRRLALPLLVPPAYAEAP